MNQPISRTEIIQQFVHSNLEMDLAIIGFLYQYTIFSLAKQERELPLSSLTRILVSLSTIQKYQNEKIKLYQALALGNLRPFVTATLLEKLERIEKQVKDIVRVMDDLISDPSVRRHMDDLVQTFYSKISFYQSMLHPPAKPWISPKMKPLYQLYQ